MEMLVTKPYLRGPSFCISQEESVTQIKSWFLELQAPEAPWGGDYHLTMAPEWLPDSDRP